MYTHILHFAEHCSLFLVTCCTLYTSEIRLSGFRVIVSAFKQYWQQYLKMFVTHLSRAFLSNLSDLVTSVEIMHTTMNNIDITPVNFILLLLTLPTSFQKYFYWQWKILALSPNTLEMHQMRNNALLVRIKTTFCTCISFVFI